MIVEGIIFLHTGIDSADTHSFFLLVGDTTKCKQTKRMNTAEDAQNDSSGNAPVHPISTSTRIRPIDILCSREPQYAEHRGNQEYMVTVSAFLLHHPDIDLDSWQERTAAGQEIVQVIRARDGRFLAKTRRGTWKDVGDEFAVRWVALHLRRMATDLEA